MCVCVCVQDVRVCVCRMCVYMCAFACVQEQATRV